MTLSHDIADYPHEVSEGVRFSETDMLGHVNNTVFGVYFEVGRSSYLSDYGFYSQDDLRLVIVKSEIQYIGMIFWPGEVEIATRVSGVGTSSFSMDQILRQKERVVGSCISVMVLIDSQTSKSKPIPDDIRAMLKM